MTTADNQVRTAKALLRISLACPCWFLNAGALSLGAKSFWHGRVGRGFVVVARSIFGNLIWPNHQFNALPAGSASATRRQGLRRAESRFLAPSNFLFATWPAVGLGGIADPSLPQSRYSVVPPFRGSSYFSPPASRLCAVIPVPARRVLPRGSYIHPRCPK